MISYLRARELEILMYEIFNSRSNKTVPGIIEQSRYRSQRISIPSELYSYYLFSSSLFVAGSIIQPIVVVLLVYPAAAAA